MPSGLVLYWPSAIARARLGGTLAHLRPREPPIADWRYRKLVDDCGGYWDWGKGWEIPAFLD